MSLTDRDDEYESLEADVRLLTRFFDKVDKNGPERDIRGRCWEWTAALDDDGYGRFKIGRKTYLSHRVSYMLIVGPLPTNMVIDHKVCQNRKCQNPQHFEVVTAVVNSNRQIKRYKAECVNGHKFNPENTRLYWETKTNTWKKICRVCDKERKALGRPKNIKRRVKKEAKVQPVNIGPRMPNFNDPTSLPKLPRISK